MRVCGSFRSVDDHGGDALLSRVKRILIKDVIPFCEFVGFRVDEAVEYAFAQFDDAFLLSEEELREAALVVLAFEETQ